MNYKMIVEIPINNVPDDVSIQEAKIKSGIWLVSKIPDAKLIKFEEQEEFVYWDDLRPNP